MSERELKDPWLVAVWPGMGKVALTAGSYLVDQLGAWPLGDLSEVGSFDVERVDVIQGVLQPVRLPRTRLYGWKHPTGGRDLLLLVGDAQPSQGSYAFCEAMVAEAVRHGARRVITFAAMVTPGHPASDPRVYVVATSAELLAEVRRQRPGTLPLEEGEITGLNGTLLAAAAAAGLSGVGLLGELPQIARNVVYPKASLAVLQVFAALAGLGLDLRPLQAQSQVVEQGLLELLQRIQRLVAEQRRPEGEPAAEEAGDAAAASWLSSGEAREEPAEDEGEGEGEELGSLRGLPGGRRDPALTERIERLFRSASEDRSKALELKAELDRHGLFKEYEDRFLDLFKR